MTIRRAFALVCALLLAAPAFCQQKKSTVPKVDGVFIDNDPYVKEFDATMTSVNNEITAIRTAIMATQIPFTKAGGMAAIASVAAQYAPVAGLMLKAEAAHMKMLKHIMGAEGSLDHDFDVRLRTPGFEEKKDATALKPHDDRIFKGPGGRQMQAVTPQAAPAVKAPGGPAAPQAAHEAAAAPRPSFQTKSSQYSFGSYSQKVGVGFDQVLAPSAPQAAYQAPATKTPAADCPPESVGDAAGKSASGAGASLGPTDGAGASSGKSDAAPPANPTGEQLSQNHSDVAQKAAERMLQRQKDAEARAKEREQKEEQKKKEKQQQQMMMMQAMMQAAGQAASKVGQNGQGAGQDSQKKTQQGQQTVDTAPM